MSRSTIDDLLRRHVQFWQPASGGRPLLAECPHPNWRPRPYPLADGSYASDPRRIVPEDIDVDKLLGFDAGLPDLTTADKIDGLRPVYPTAWMASLLGCPIVAGSASCSARPAAAAGEDGMSAFDVEAALRSPWLDLMDRVLAEAVTAAGSAYPTMQLHLRGVIDMLAAYLGEQRLCIGLYDCPDRLGQLAGAFADLYIEVARRGLRLRPAWRGGCVSVWGLYAPGDLVDYQIDASCLISPDAYRAHFTAVDAKVLSAFDYSLVHLHAIGLHLIDTVLDTGGLRAVQINLDREAGRWDQAAILAAGARVQDRGKSLLLSGELDDRELAEFLDALQPGGLAIFYWKPRPSCS